MFNIRKKLCLWMLCCLCSMGAFAQKSPVAPVTGINYQAVARDEKGQILAGKTISLRIQLYAGGASGKTAYVETHRIQTNELGLFSLVVGQGEVVAGSFAAIPWETMDIWMELALDDQGGKDFITLNATRLMAVPYAFHALSADKLTDGNDGGDEKAAAYWKTNGNDQINSAFHFIGTTESSDLVFKTNNIERLRITAAGLISIGGTIGADNFSVTQDATVGDELTVGGIARFNNTTQSTTRDNGAVIVEGGVGIEKNVNIGGNAEVDGTLGVDGVATLNNTTQSSSKDNGALVVEGGVGIEKNVNVGGNAEVDGTLGVDGVTTLNNTTQSSSKDNGALVVEGGVGIEKNANIGGNAEVDGTLGVDGVTTLNNTTESSSKDDGALVLQGGVGIEKNLNIGGTFSAKGTNTSFMAYIENADSDSGDGLEIKLGKTHPAWDGSAYLNITSPAADIFDGAVSTVSGWIDGENFEGDDLLSFIPAAYIAGAACNLVNLLSDQLNEGLDLPLNFPELTIIEETEIFPGLALPDPLPNIPSIDMPEITIPSFLLIPEIPEIPCSALPNFSTPNINAVNVSNSLTKANKFVSFKDKESRELGSIRAQSATDWRTDYLDATRIIDFVSEMTGADFIQGVAKVFSTFTILADSYNSIGVEYASGHGDYAEWLERIDSKEMIHPGDIVAVKGGKITKDLSQAEQVMAVSYRPIVLGNAPTEAQEAKGNKVAFMGQIPVKVQGPVQAGDYIVGNPSTPGYGIAVSPKAMTAELAHLTVGRSWESKPNPGPKMVNTVVGVDNGNFLKIIQDNQNHVNELDARLRALEAKMEAMLNKDAEASGNNRRKGSRR